MESLKSASFYQKIVVGILKRFKKGLIKITMPDGEVLTIGDGKGLSVDFKIHNPDFFKKIVKYGDIGFGEAFCDGDWSTSNLTNLIRWTIQNVETSGVISGSPIKEWSVNLLGKINHVGHFFKQNSKSGSSKNISYHYDVSNDFYELILGESMCYSCGIFEGKEFDLHQSQIQKLKAICSDLDIRPNDHILEIGCGWGGFAIYAVTNFGCRITGITISKEQYNFATEKVKKLGLQDKITILLQDYRDLHGQFDKVVSIEMIEAVGHEFLPKYFQTIDRLLKNDGVAVVQAITSPDSRYDLFRTGVDFIQKHIFPGSLLPSVASMTEACRKSKTNLHLYNLRDIGLHYPKTLELWRERMFKNKAAITQMGMDEIFFRKWNYYFSYCEAAFAERNISDVQVTFIKPNNTTYKYHLES
jgi:cyclopropane-fatty-acyl-phospholipid synthase